MEDHELPTDWVREHLDAVHEELDALSAACEPFRQADWFVDCDDVPCVLGIRYAHAIGAEGYRAVTCGRIRSLMPVFTQLGDPDPITYVPLLQWDPEDRLPVLRERYERAKVWRSWGIRHWTAH